MKKSLIISLIFLTMAFGIDAQSARVQSFLEREEAIPMPPGVEVYFGPSENLEDRVVELIESATTEIVFNAYAITSHKVLTALMDAYVNRKLFIAGLLDPKPAVSRYTTPQYFQVNGLPFAYPRITNAYNNNSYIVIDRRVVLTGSYQFTQTRTPNEENFIIIYEPAVAIKYYNHFVTVFEDAVMPKPLQTERYE